MISCLVLGWLKNWSSPAAGIEGEVATMLHEGFGRRIWTNMGKRERIDRRVFWEREKECDVRREMRKW